MADRVLCSESCTWGVLEDVPGFVRSLIAMCHSASCNTRAVLLDCEFFSTRVFEALGKMGVSCLATCKNTDIVVDAIAEIAAGRRPAVSEMCIAYAYGVSVRYAIIITERRKKKKKSGKENSDEEGGGILPRRKSLSDLSPTCSSRTLSGTQKERA